MILPAEAMKSNAMIGPALIPQPATRVRRSPTAEIKFWVPCHVPRGRLEQKQAAKRKGWRRKDVRGAVALVCTIGFSRARMRCART